MEVERQGGRAKWVWGIVILGVIAGLVLQLGGPWTGQRVLAGALGLLRESEQVKSKAEHAITPYPVGQAVLVDYNPRRPGDSALEPGVPPLSRTSVVLSLVMLALGACGWLATFAAR